MFENCLENEQTKLQLLHLKLKELFHIYLYEILVITLCIVSAFVLGLPVV